MQDVARSRGKGHDVARCTVKRLMAANGWEGARYGKTAPLTTVADQAHQRPADLVDRQFHPHAPKRLWVTDFERHEALSNRVGVGDLHRRAVAAARS